MKLVNSLHELVTLRINSSVCTIGVFDGIHKGHMAVLNTLLEIAKEKDTNSVVVTFRNLPEDIFVGQTHRVLLHPELKIQLLESIGIDICIMLEFNYQVAEKTAVEWIEEVLYRKLGVKSIVIGEDFTFGKEREGDINLLKQYENKYDYEVHIVEPVVIKGMKVSSSYIRKLITTGMIREVNMLLGRPYIVRGAVKRGRGRGIKLGFPTINFAIKDQHMPNTGVYAVSVRVREKWFKGAANVGFAPSFSIGEIKEPGLEVYIIDFPPEDLYNTVVDIAFIDRIREEKRFSTPEELVGQIKKDIALIKSMSWSIDLLVN